MKQYLYEIHAHTSDVSPCAHVKPEKVVEFYQNEGYDGIVITDHMSPVVFKRMAGEPWQIKVDYFLSGYRKALSHAHPGFSVLPGMELCFINDSNDYLVYGFDEDFLYRHEDLTNMNLRQFRKIADDNGLLIFQAHPFRKNMRVVEPRLLDGIEVYNGNSSHNSNNDIAILWADKYGLLKISGSDFHRFFGMRPGGLYFPYSIKTNAELVEALRSKEYKIR